MSPAGAVPQSRRQPAPGAVLAIASFGAFLAFLDSTIVNVAFPDIARSFPTATIGELSWVFNAYNIVFAAFLVAAGRVADLLGRKRMFIYGVVLFTLTSAGCALAGTLSQLVALRALQGLGAAMLVPASLALVVEGFSASRRAHGIGLWGASAAVASGLGPPIGGGLVALSDWRLVFLINIPLGVGAVVVARRGLVESRAPGRRRVPDLRGAALLGACLGLLTLGVVQGEDWGWSSAGVVVALLASAAALAAFVASSRSHPSPMLDPSLLRIRSFAVGNAVTLVAGMGFYAYLLTHILYLSYVWDYSLLRAGLAVAPGAFVAAVTAAVLGKVADRRGHRLIAVPGALLWAGSFLWYLTRVTPEPDFLGAWLPGQVLSGIGVGATLPVLASAALVAVPGGGYATASAVVASARQMGAVLGISLLVVIIGAPTAETADSVLRDGWVLSAVCFLLVAAGSALLGRTAAPDVSVPADDVPPPHDDEAVPAAALPAQRRPHSAPVVEPAGDVALADLPLFQDLPRAVLRRLERISDDVDLPAGSYLFREGSRSDALYVVRSGRLQVTCDGQPINELGRGAVLGELGLLTGAPRSASVHALRDSSLVRLTERDFLSVADTTVLRTLACGLATRLQQTQPPVQTGQSNGVIAVVGLDAAAPVEAVSAALVAAMSSWLDVVDPGRVERDGLERAERMHDRVVLTAAVRRGDKQWRDHCLRVADRVVLVCGTTEVPDRLPARAEGADLVLPRPASGAASLAWHARIRPRSASVADDQDLKASLRALAARLSGRSLGLVLGGGGARAFAHIGVLEELEAAGLHVDRVAGTSVGAAIAAMYATGTTAAGVDAAVYENFVRRNPIGDWTLPTKSLIRGRITVDGANRVFGDTHIEQLPREFRAVSVDLLARSRYVHDRGRVADAVAASLRLPGLYPPYLLEGRLHVDGGVLDNLPVSTLAEPREGPVVAVSISFGGSGGGRSATRPRIPALGDTLMRTMMMSSASAAEQARAQADVVISPDAAGVGLLEFHQIDRMREQGRIAARAALPAVEAALSAAPARPTLRTAAQPA